MVQVSRSSAGVSPVSCQVDDAPHPGVAGDRGDLGLDLGAGAAGLAAGQGGGQFVESAAGLGQGGAGEAAGLVFVQFDRVGQDGAAVGAVDGAAGVVGGQPGEAVGVDDAAGGGGQGEQVAAVAGRHRSHVVQAGAGQLREVGL